MRLRRLLQFARPYRMSLALCTGLMLVETAAALSLPWLGGQFAASVLDPGEMALDTLLLAMFALLALRSLLRYLHGAILAGTFARILADLRRRLYDQVQSLPLGYFRERNHGDTLSLTVYEVERLGGFITGPLLGTLPNVLAIAGALVLMARIDPALAALVLALVPLFYVTLRLIGRRLRPGAQETRDAYAALVGLVGENISMMPAIKAFTREAAESRRHAGRAERLRALSVRQSRIQARLGPAIQLLVAGSVLVLLRLLGERVATGAMTTAELVSFLLYAALLTAPFSSLAGVWGQMQHARGALTRLDALLEETPEPLREGKPLAAVRGEIAFEDAHLSYPGRAPVLRGVDLRLDAGETVALTGPNGAGKTTLVNLLLRFDSPDRGRILIDGTDIAEVSLESLRRQIGLVPQTPLLFNASLRDNIVIGRPDATDAEIERAARLAQAHDFIAALPEGYDTIIGERGVRLSGGQCQRVALARALLQDPAILILDEPTAMFDPDGETAFIAEARQAFADKTVILITHRPASLALADRVVRLVDGRVESDGAGAALPRALAGQ